jgi:acyl-CoA thioesterase
MEQKNDMDKVKEFNDKDAFARHSGVEIVDIGEGSARGRLVLKPHHLNGVGIVHGAAIFTLADAVFAAASNSHGHVAVAINVNISYLKPTENGILYADARENNARGRIGSYTITITDETGQTTALFEGLAYRKF